MVVGVGQAQSWGQYEKSVASQKDRTIKGLRFAKLQNIWMLGLQF